MEILSILSKSSLESGEVTHACDPSPWELEVGESGVGGQFQLHKVLSQKKTKGVGNNWRLIYM